MMFNSLILVSALFTTADVVVRLDLLVSPPGEAGSALEFPWPPFVNVGLALLAAGSSLLFFRKKRHLAICAVFDSSLRPATRIRVEILGSAFGAWDHVITSLGFTHVSTSLLARR